MPDYRHFMRITAIKAAGGANRKAGIGFPEFLIRIQQYRRFFFYDIDTFIKAVKYCLILNHFLTDLLCFFALQKDG